MSEINNDLLAEASAAADTAADMRETNSGGGGDYVPPAAGNVWLRFVGYIEYGVHSVEVNVPGKAKVTKDQPGAYAVFELSGPNHPPKDINGTLVPQRISVELENLSRNEKARSVKLFNKMNHTGEYKTFAQMLGKPFLGEIFHEKSKDGQRTYASLRNKDGEFGIRSHRYADPIDQQIKEVPVPPPLSPLRLFLWDTPSKKQWDSIFIDGQYEEKKDATGAVTKPARSKNVYQLKIKAAKNFKDSPIAQLLSGADQLDLPAPTSGGTPAPAASGASVDPLAQV